MKSIQLADLSHLKSTLSEKHIPLLNSLFGIIILFYLLKLTVVLLPAAPVKIDTDPLLQSAQNIHPIPTIASLHLFGVYQMHDATALPIAQIGLTLQGILYATQAADSQAIIATANGNTKTYKIGDSVNGATIKQILPTDVIIDTGGTLQRLPLIRPNLELENMSS